MPSPLDRYLQAAAGLTAVTRSSAERIVQQLVATGELATAQMPEAVQDLISRSREQRELLTALVQQEIQRTIRTMGLATEDDLERLRQDLDDLRRQLAADRVAAAAQEDDDDE